jgi:hypothetical protein
MAANDFIYASVPLASDLEFTNTETSTAIVAGNVVKIDATNVVSGTQPTFGGLQGTAAATGLLGIAMEAIPVGKTGRVRPFGVAQAVASGAITAGAVVAAGSTGKVAAQTSGQAQLGYALTTVTTDGDKILILVSLARNA